MVGTMVTGQPQAVADVLALGQRNLLRNGGFDNVSLVATNQPHRWEKELTPTVVSDTDVATGAGAYNDETPRSIKITAAGAANEGIKQTLSNLKASTIYTVKWRAKATAGDTWSVVTTGASTNISETGTSSTWETGEAQFTTDGSATDVVLKLLAAADTDIVWFDDVRVQEGRGGPRPWQPHALDKAVESGSYDNLGSAATYAGMRIETGRVNEASNPTTVTFGTAFAKDVTVVLTVLKASAARFAQLETVSVSNFTLQVYDDAGTQQDEIVYWMAIGYD
jgi:hypothetical protein